MPSYSSPKPIMDGDIFMGDMVYTPRRPGIRINIHTADMVNIVKQADVIASFTIEEMHSMIEAFQLELNYRENSQQEGEENAVTETK